MWRMSSIKPTKKSSELPANITAEACVNGTNNSYIKTVVRKIAEPPSIAVGFLCQRSDFGVATKFRFRAKPRTAKVNNMAMIKLPIASKKGFEDS